MVHLEDNALKFRPMIIVAEFEAHRPIGYNLADHKREFLFEPLAGYDAAITDALWMLEDSRRETKLVLAGVKPAVLDWSAPEGSNSIGTLLYHIPAIEIDWLYHEVLEQTF